MNQNSSTTKLDRVVQGSLILVAIPFALMAILGWFLPHHLFAPCQVSLDDACGIAEVRAAYGGLFSTTAALFVYGAIHQPVRRLALGVATSVLGGFVFGRIISLIVEGIPNHAALLSLCAEVVGCIICLSLLIATRSQKLSKQAA